jgi:hypothetical protein
LAYNKKGFIKMEYIIPPVTDNIFPIRNWSFEIFEGEPSSCNLVPIFSALKNTIIISKLAPFIKFHQPKDKK